MRSQIVIVLALSGLILSAATPGLTDGTVPPPPSSVGHAPDPKSPGNVLLSTGHKHVIINEMNVLKLDGTIMVEHADKTAPTALQTGDVVEKGDVITVYGSSWVIFKSHRGDQIGMSGNTVVTIDECFMEGPDRQIRLLVQKGTLLLRTNGDDSRQSFFEINMGNVVASIDNLQAIMSYDPSKNFVDIKYINGKIHVIDQTHEETFSQQQSEYNGYTKTETQEENQVGVPEEHTEHTWVNGKMAEEEPIPLDELDEINFKKFFNGEKLLVPDDNNILLDDSHQVPYRQR